VESFQVRVRWNEIPSLRRISRSRSRPICTGGPDHRPDNRRACEHSSA
jgi:hypothetical protein